MCHTTPGAKCNGHDNFRAVIEKKMLLQVTCKDYNGIRKSLGSLMANQDSTNTTLACGLLHNQRRSCVHYKLLRIKVQVFFYINSYTPSILPLWASKQEPLLSFLTSKMELISLSSPGCWVTLVRQLAESWHTVGTQQMEFCLFLKFDHDF